MLVAEREDQYLKNKIDDYLKKPKILQDSLWKPLKEELDRMKEALENELSEQQNDLKDRIPWQRKDTIDLLKYLLKKSPSSNK